MATIDETLEILRFELKFVEDGGYGRFPRAPWRSRFIFEDSNTCPNFGDPSRTIPCEQCALIQFVPEEQKAQQIPCRHIPLNKEGQTIENLYHHGTQIELEEALKGWLRREIARLEALSAAGARPVEQAR